MFSMWTPDGVHIFNLKKHTMFSLFKTDPLAKLRKKHKALLKESFDLSRTNRKLSDMKSSEAEDVLRQIEALKNESK